MNLIKINKIEKISIILLFLLPLSIIFSKFVSDFIIVIFALFYFINIENANTNLNRKFYLNFFSIAFFLFITFSSISSILSSNQLLSLKSSFLHFRFLFSAIFLSYIFLLDTNKTLKIFFYILLSCYLALLFDGSYQFIFKENIFGYSPDPQTRVSSFFFDELVLGSYLSRLFPILVFLYVFLKLRINKFLILYFLIHLYFVCFISGERLSFFILNIYYFLFSIFFLKGKFKKILFIFTFICIFLSSLHFSDNFNSRSSISTIFNQFSKFNFSVCNATKEKIIANKYLQEKYDVKRIYANLFDMDLKSIPNCNPIFEIGNLKIYYIFSLMHHNHYITAIEIFKDNILFGIGPKNFRYTCDDKNYFLNEFSCSTHPHNYLLQTLSETGIFGFVSFVTIYLGFIYLFFKELFNFNRKVSLPKLVLISSILINFFPFFPSGSLFNNWNSIMYTIPLGMLLGYYRHSIWN